jgi:hypothetical protein
MKLGLQLPCFTLDEAFRQRGCLERFDSGLSRDLAQCAWQRRLPRGDGLPNPGGRDGRTLRTGVSRLARCGLPAHRPGFFDRSFHMRLDPRRVLPRTADLERRNDAASPID